ncbi:acetate--CoA ligase family protein [Caminibacter pacificus]
MKEAEVYKLLDKYGISHPKYKLFKLNEEVSFDTFPCVIKIHSDKVVHKSDVGGVITNIQNNRSLKSAKKEIIKNLKKHSITLDEDDEFIVEEEIKGIELFLGGVFDTIFEETIVFGKGGTLVEIEKDITYIDTESDEKEILKSIEKTKISKIFPQFRGKKYDLKLLIKTIKKFQKMFKNEDILEIDINPLIINEKGIFAVDARIKKGEKQKKEFVKKNNSLFNIKNVAIFGATDKKEKVGYAIAKNALKSKANIYFVNPKLKTLFNKKVYNSLNQLPQIDTAVIAIPTKYVLENVKSLIKKGVKNIIIISAGFKESGNIQAEEELSRLAKENDINIVGPNCLGIYYSKLNLNLTFAKSKIYKGKIGLISQSGAVLTALMDKASKYKIGFSHIISMGNMADFNFAHAIKELNEQKSCEVIAIYAEGMQFGKAFLEAIRNSKKPILLFKAGKSDAAKKAAFSHTGNIAGDYEMIMTLSEIAGAKIKDSIESLIFSPKFLNEQNVIILTNAGGPGTILTDLVSKHKDLLELDKKTIEKLNAILPPTWSHNNPIDIIGDATAKRYKNALEVIKNLSDIIFVIITPQYMTNAKAIAKELLNYKNTIPILLGDKSFESAKKLLDKNKKFYFTSLEEASKIL